jgi:hypothetical protein
MKLLLRFLLLTVLCSSVDVKRGDGHESVLDEQQAPETRPLHACALCDFVDEASRTKIMKDARTAEIVALLHKRRIPVFFNRYMRSYEKHRFLNDIDTIRSRREYTGYVFYEVYSYVNYNADGTCTFKYPEITKAIRHAAQSDPKSRVEPLVPQ